MNFKRDFGTSQALFLVSDVKIKHCGKIRQISQTNKTSFRKTPLQQMKIKIFKINNKRNSFFQDTSHRWYGQLQKRSVWGGNHTKMENGLNASSLSIIIQQEMSCRISEKTF